MSLIARILIAMSRGILCRVGSASSLQTLQETASPTHSSRGMGSVWKRHFGGCLKKSKRGATLTSAQANVGQALSKSLVIALILAYMLGCLASSANATTTNSEKYVILNINVFEKLNCTLNGNHVILAAHNYSENFNKPNNEFYIWMAGCFGLSVFFILIITAVFTLKTSTTSKSSTKLHPYSLLTIFALICLSNADYSHNSMAIMESAEIGKPYNVSFNTDFYLNFEFLEWYFNGTFLTNKTTENISFPLIFYSNLGTLMIPSVTLNYSGHYLFKIGRQKKELAELSIKLTVYEHFEQNSTSEITAEDFSSNHTIQPIVLVLAGIGITAIIITIIVMSVKGCKKTSLTIPDRYYARAYITEPMFTMALLCLINSVSASCIQTQSVVALSGMFLGISIGLVIGLFIYCCKKHYCSEELGHPSVFYVETPREETPPPPYPGSSTPPIVSIWTVAILCLAIAPVNCSHNCIETPFGNIHPLPLKWYCSVTFYPKTEENITGMVKYYDRDYNFKLEAASYDIYPIAFNSSFTIYNNTEILHFKPFSLCPKPTNYVIPLMLAIFFGTLSAIIILATSNPERGAADILFIQMEAGQHVEDVFGIIPNKMFLFLAVLALITPTQANIYTNPFTEDSIDFSIFFFLSIICVIFIVAVCCLNNAMPGAVRAEPRHYYNFMFLSMNILFLIGIASGQETNNTKPYNLLASNAWLIGGCISCVCVLIINCFILYLIFSHLYKYKQAMISKNLESQSIKMSKNGTTSSKQHLLLSVLSVLSICCIVTANKENWQIYDYNTKNTDFVIKAYEYDNIFINLKNSTMSKIVWKIENLTNKHVIATISPGHKFQDIHVQPHGNLLIGNCKLNLNNTKFTLRESSSYNNKLNKEGHVKFYMRFRLFVHLKPQLPIYVYNYTEKKTNNPTIINCFHKSFSLVNIKANIKNYKTWWDIFENQNNFTLNVPQHKNHYTTYNNGSLKIKCSNKQNNAELFFKGYISNTYVRFAYIQINFAKNKQKRSVYFNLEQQSKPIKKRAYIGQQLELQGTASSYPHWTYDNGSTSEAITLQNNSHHKIYKNGSLILNITSEKQAGKYMATTGLYIPEYVYSLEIIHTILVDFYKGFSGMLYVPIENVLYVIWYFNDIKIDFETNIQLILTQVEFNNSGTYKAIVTTKHLFRTTFYFKVTVKTPITIFYGKENEEFKFSTNIQPSNAFWIFRNNVYYFGQIKDEIEVSNTGSFTILACHLQHNGKYSLMQNTIYGYSSVIAFELIVPQFWQETFFIDSYGKLTNPIPNSIAKWSFKNKTLSDQEEYKYIVTNNSLTVKNVQNNDKGLYFLKVINNSNIHFEITFNVSVNPPKEEIVVCNLNTDCAIPLDHVNLKNVLLLEWQLIDLLSSDITLLYFFFNNSDFDALINEKYTVKNFSLIIKNFTEDLYFLLKVVNKNHPLAKYDYDDTTTTNYKFFAINPNITAVKKNTNQNSFCNNFSCYFSSSFKHLSQIIKHYLT